jgi:hypothetical protein
MDPSDPGDRADPAACPVRPALVPVVERWACQHCGGGGLDSSGVTCQHCDGLGHSR